MKSSHALVIAVGLVVSGQLVHAQDLSRYRAYVLESSVDTVVATTGARATEVSTLHKRPATIQELQWRLPYASPGNAPVDPVRAVAFTFVDNALYQVLVTYDRERTAGLTNEDVIQALSASYGPPALQSVIVRTELPPAMLDDANIVAQWSDATASLTLLRGMYSPDFQLILLSKALSARARGAIREAIKLDALEAPQREMEKRKQELADASAARDKTRATNKAAFQP